ncbi:PREDICTED: flap endonuclease GEN homolog 1 [Chrysochloris asiatica]|uniref:Flap endonuclease GEN homolog 1 n=1 Tax=Chrysochloris asiatica TaxID=185453 RepID=A0A9B0T4E7_CHRAS|nr:PREDICTED: flap endonuclease GEN homolog 1 [Chrysochloris asiatica]
MGVNDLWQILEPVKQHTHLYSLSGKTIAVDLSLWVCEAQAVKKMIGTVLKPHLRNLFFRISFLTLMDVKLIFVMEGEPPKLKADVISKRNQIRYGPSGKTASQKTGRSHFKSVLRECLDMLQCLGIPWVQAAGEAEAMCAYLNANGYVDGCLTNDGDAFLYGAQTVYRNFTMNTKDPHVECYTMSSIKSKLGLDRDALVGLSILLGCDYLPKGVPGVGKEQALKLIQALKGQSLLQRFNQWNEESCCSDTQAQVVKKLPHCSVCSHPGSSKDHERNGCKLCKSSKYCEPHDYEYCCPCEWHLIERGRQLNAVENSIKKKACSCEGFPFPEVTQEFLLSKDKLPKVIRFQRPDLLLFQRFTSEKMEWPNHYACEKLLVLMTHYDMIERKFGRRNSCQLQPIRIVKTRIRNGIHCFEVEWGKPEHYAIEDKQHGELVLQTIEEKLLFEAAYPEIVAVYQKQKLGIKGKIQKSMKLKPKENYLPESDDTRFQSHINLKPVCVTFPKQSSKLYLEFSPDSKLPQEYISQSPNSFLLPEDASCLDIQDKLMSSPRPLVVHEVKNVSNFLTSEASQPNHFSHNISVIDDLHLSTIDWESTSFSNSPAPQKNVISHNLKSELEITIPNSVENISEQLSCESEWYTTNINKVADEDLQKTSPGEHLLSGITDLHIQDLPLKERVRIKSSYPQDKVQPNIGLKTLSLLKVKEPCVANSSFVCPSHFSKNLLKINSQNGSRNSEVLKEDQLRQENEKINTVLNHGRKANIQTTQKIVMKSVCPDRHSSDEESDSVFEKSKYTFQKMKSCSQKQNPTQLKRTDPNKVSNQKLHIKETEQYVQVYKISGNEVNYSVDPAQSSQHFLQCPKDKEDLDTCLDSPLPLCQRLKLRFQSTCSLK